MDMQQATPTPLRSLVKAMTWRTVASLDTLMLSWFFTGNIAAAFTIAGGEVFTKMAIYYFHERAWAHVTWGHNGYHHSAIYWLVRRWGNARDAVSRLFTIGKGQSANQSNVGKE